MVSLNDSDLKTNEVRDLQWVIDSPGLLRPGAFPGRVESDRAVGQFFRIIRHHLRAWDKNPEVLLDFLRDREPPQYRRHAVHGSDFEEQILLPTRLGRRFENLLLFLLTCRLSSDPQAPPSILVQNCQVLSREPPLRRTLGEFDFVFSTPTFPRPRHWETSVKFYVCIAQSAAECQDSRRYLGSLVQDRLDRKIRKLLISQLGLSHTFSGRSTLNSVGLSEPDSRALLKGMIFYPLEISGRTPAWPAAEFLNPDHRRGWWTPAKMGARTLLPSMNQQHSRFFIVLPMLRWLAHFHDEVDRRDLHDDTSIHQIIEHHFAEPPLRSRPELREMMLAEVVITEECGDRVRVLEVSRGHIADQRWLEVAQNEALVPLTDLHTAGDSERRNVPEREKATNAAKSQGKPRNFI